MMRRWFLLLGFFFFTTLLGSARAAAPAPPSVEAVAVPQQSPAGTWVTQANADRVRVLRAQGNTVWAGSQGGGLVGWDVTDAAFVQLLYPQDRLAGNVVTAITIGTDETLWAATTAGVSRYPPGGLGQDLTLKNTSQRAAQKAAVQEAAITGEREIRLQGITSRPAAEAAFAPGYLMFGDDPTIYFYRDWDTDDQEIVISPSLLRSVEPGTPVYAVDIGLAADDVRDLVIDHSGRVWISTVNGVSTYENGNWTVFTKPYYPLVSNDAGVMAVDRAGRVWISHQERGQFTMYDGGWHTYSIEGTIQNLAVNPEDGNVWAATSRLCDPTGACRGGGVWAFDGANWQRRYSASDGIANDDVTKIAFGAAGRLWLGHELSDRIIVSRWTGSTWIVHQTVQEAIESDFNGIATTQTASDLWTVAGGRVWTRHLGAVRGYAPGDGWQVLYTGGQIVNSNHIRAIAADDAGNVWVGAERTFDGKQQVGGGVNVWDGDQWTQYTAENSSLPDNLISAITAGRGRVWVQTLSSYARFANGVWTTFPDIESLVETDYGSIVNAWDLMNVNEQRMWTVDDEGRVWIGGGSGAKSYAPEMGWRAYTFESTQDKSSSPASFLQANASARETFIRVASVDIPDSATAQSIFSNGYLMIGDDPTIYRYESFEPDPRADASRLQISPALSTNYDAGTAVYTIDLGLLSNLVSDVAVGPDGRMWFATRPHRVGSTDVYGGVSVLDDESETWTHYTVRNTSRRGAVVGQVTADTGVQATLVPADFGSASAANQALASGFVMFGDDPTLYRYIGYSTSEQAIVVHPIFTTLKYLVDVGLQQSLPAGTVIHAVDLGLLGAPQSGDGWADQLTLDHRGRMWIAVRGVGISVLDELGEWTNFRRADDGLASVQITAMLLHDDEMWVPTGQSGVSVYREAGWQTYSVFNSGLIGDQIEALSLTEEGEIWIGTQDRGISVLTLPGFRLDASTSTVLAVPGGTSKLHLDVVPLGGFSDSVDLTVEGMPPGVSATLTPDTVNTSGTVTLTLDVSAPVAAGSYPLTVVGRSVDGLTARRQLTLKVVSSAQQMFLPLVSR